MSKKNPTILMNLNGNIEKNWTQIASKSHVNQKVLALSAKKVLKDIAMKYGTKKIYFESPFSWDLAGANAQYRSVVHFFVDNIFSVEPEILRSFFKFIWNTSYIFVNDERAFDFE